jgi:hypothetical protein
MTALSLPSTFALLLLTFISSFGITLSLYSGRSPVSVELIVLDTSINAEAQSFVATAAESSRCLSTLQGNSVLQLIAPALPESQSIVQLGLYKIAVELWSAAGDRVIDRHDLPGAAPLPPHIVLV